jgi:hypothetical protein
MRLKLLLAILFSSLALANAQKHRVQPKAKQQIGNVSSIKQIGDNISVDQMTIMQDKNLNPFIKELENSRLKISYKLDDLPGSVRAFLESFSGDKFTIANLGADWNCCCDQNDNRPNRELICYGTNGYLFMISYYTGGIGKMQHLILVDYDGESINDFWAGNVQGNLTNRFAIIESLKSHKFQHWATKDRINI